MYPFSIVARIGKQRFRLDRSSRFVEQRPSYCFVVARSPAQHEAGRQHSAAGHAQRQLHVPLTLSTSPRVEVGTGRSALDTRRVDRYFLVRLLTLAHHLTNNIGQNRVDNGQRIGAVRKVFKRRVMRQSPQSQALFQFIRRFQKFDDASIRCLEVRSQDQTSHQLSLCELMWTLRVRVGLHVSPGELHA